MKILLVTMGTDGDVHPFIALGLVLRSRGHDVILLANEHYADRVNGTLAYEPLGTEREHRRVIEDPFFWDPIRGSRVVAEWGMSQIRRQYAVIERLYEPGRTVVASPASVIGARLAQERLGTPLATIVLQPAVFRSLHRLPVVPGVPRVPRWMPRFAKGVFWKGIDAVADNVLASRVSAFRRELGLPPLRGFLEWWLSPQLVIGLFPDWFGCPQPDWPEQVSLTQFPMHDHQQTDHLPDDVTAFLERGEAPIVFTPGTGVGHGRAFFHAAAAACRRLSSRGVFLTPFRSQVSDVLTEAITYFAYVPFGQLLSRAAAIVHHGGIGTLSHAMAAGIPQLIMPRSFDQPDNAQRIKELGIGDTLRPMSFRPRAIARKLSALLQSPSVRANCRSVANRFRTERPLDEACDLIERMPWRDPTSDSASVVERGRALV